MKVNRTDKPLDQQNAWRKNDKTFNSLCNELFPEPQEPTETIDEDEVELDDGPHADLTVINCD